MFTCSLRDLALSFSLTLTYRIILHSGTFSTLPFRRSLAIFRLRGVAVFFDCLPFSPSFSEKTVRACPRIKFVLYRSELCYQCNSDLCQPLGHGEKNYVYHAQCCFTELTYEEQTGIIPSVKLSTYLDTMHCPPHVRTSECTIGPNRIRERATCHRPESRRCLPPLGKRKSEAPH